MTPLLPIVLDSSPAPAPTPTSAQHTLQSLKAQERRPFKLFIPLPWPTCSFSNLFTALALAMNAAALPAADEGTVAKRDGGGGSTCDSRPVTVCCGVDPLSCLSLSVLGGGRVSVFLLSF